MEYRPNHNDGQHVSERGEGGNKRFSAAHLIACFARDVQNEVRGHRDTLPRVCADFVTKECDYGNGVLEEAAQAQELSSQEATNTQSSFYTLSQLKGIRDGLKERLEKAKGERTELSRMLKDIDGQMDAMYVRCSIQHSLSFYLSILSEDRLQPCSLVFNHFSRFPLMLLLGFQILNSFDQ